MKSQEIHFGDWTRILLGETPPQFLIEVIIRLMVIYLLLVISMRGLGRRMSAQLSRTELVGLVSLAAAIGIPMQTPERGLLPAVVIAIVVVGIGRVTASLAVKNEQIEKVLQDNISTLVQDGVLQLKTMQKTRLSRERVFAQLRDKGIYQLGEVKRLYLEANGSFSLMRNDPKTAGLNIIPGWDTELHAELESSNNLVCSRCATTITDPKGGPCSNCGSGKTEKAVCS